MDANSPKPTQTGSDDVQVIQFLQDWLEREGGNQRIPQVLGILAQQTVRAWELGGDGPGMDADHLRQLYHDMEGGKIPTTPASRWLQSTQVERWWGARQVALMQAAEITGITGLPVLDIQKGGGRGNSTLYRFSVVARDSLEDPSESVQAPMLSGGGTDEHAGVFYQVETAKAAWWLRLIIGDKPFRMRSARGWSLISLLLASAFAVVGMWIVILRLSSQLAPAPQGFLPMTLAGLVVTFVWWHTLKPLFRLPADRVTIGNDSLLAMSQLNGQFRLARDAKKKALGGWFSLVRHSAVCPLCAGTIEVLPGGRAFPDRIVGRCSESPMEHVFSFDPVRLQGRPLR